MNNYIDFLKFGNEKVNQTLSYMIMQADEEEQEKKKREQIEKNKKF